MHRRPSSSAFSLRRLHRWASRWMVLALVLPIAISQWSPLFARLVAGPEAHVCHCDLRGDHVECACPVCNPGRDDLLSDELAIRGSCGDDALAPGKALVLPAILPAESSLVPYAQRAPCIIAPLIVPRQPSQKPPTPPPEAASLRRSRGAYVRVAPRHSQ